VSHAEATDYLVVQGGVHHTLQYGVGYARARTPRKMSSATKSCLNVLWTLMQVTHGSFSSTSSAFVICTCVVTQTSLMNGACACVPCVVHEVQHLCAESKPQHCRQAAFDDMVSRFCLHA
jgi:hypothetical protein